MCLSQRADTAKHSKRTFQLFWKEAKKKNKKPLSKHKEQTSPLPVPLPINGTANWVKLLANRMVAFHTPFPCTGMQRDRTLRAAYHTCMVYLKIR